MATAAQIDANRKNAQLSTGPRSTVGKKSASRNAVRHGILASVIPASTPGYAELLLGLYSSLNPMDEPQRLLVDQIAVTAIRLSRVVACEQEWLERAPRAPEVSDPGAASSPMLAYLQSDAALVAMRYEAMLNRTMHRMLRQYKEMKADWDWNLARKGETPFLCHEPIPSEEPDRATDPDNVTEAEIAPRDIPADSGDTQTAPDEPERHHASRLPENVAAGCAELASFRNSDTNVPTIAVRISEASAKIQLQ